MKSACPAAPHREPPGRRAGLGGLEGARNDLAAVLAQHPADRLDPELTTITALPGDEAVVAVLVDVDRPDDAPVIAFDSPSRRHVIDRWLRHITLTV
jgi:hypothetical protein